MPISMPLPREEDILALSLQSKSVKFLSFLDEPIYPQLSANLDRGILYFDHKFEIKEDHVRRIVSCAEDSAIVIRSTPLQKDSIWDEVEAAVGQERYMRHMTETKSYIERSLGAGMSADARICNTGLIYYADVEAARPLAQSVLSSCLQLKQPECQIFWSLHAQRYSDMIKVIDWNDPAVQDVLWEDPNPALPEPPRSKAGGMLGKLRRLLAR